MLTRPSFAVALALAASAAVVAGTVPAGAAAPSPHVTTISPVSGPQSSSIPFRVHGAHFDTDPGATSISFGGTEATDVNCPKPSVCTAMTPEIAATGPVEVTVTTGGVALNPVLFTVTAYSPPVVRIAVNAHGDAIFSQTQLGDTYPAMSNPGDDFFNIENQTAADQTVTCALLGPLTVPAGATLGYDLPLGAGPYVFFITGSPKAVLTVKAKSPA